MDKKYIVRRGGNVTVEINRRKTSSPKSQVSSPKGLIKLRREDDYLPRRLPNEIVITFYGLNLKKGEDEQFHDLDFQIEPNVSGTIDRSGGEFSEIKKLAIDRFSESN